LPNSIVFHTKTLMGVTLGVPSAVGAYREEKEGNPRYDVVAIAAASSDEARDLSKTLRARPRATALADFGDDAVAVPIDEGGATREFLFARKGSLLFGVGDDPFAGASAPAPAPANSAAVSGSGSHAGAGSGAGQLSRDDKKAHLKAILNAASASPATSASSSAGGAPTASTAPPPAHPR
jgi:hypothetical protein